MSNKTNHRNFVQKGSEVFPIVIDDKLNDILDVVLKKVGDANEQTLIIIYDCANPYHAKLKATWSDQIGVPWETFSSDYLGNDPKLFRKFLSFQRKFQGLDYVS
jgi:hypothetical protein